MTEEKPKDNKAPAQQKSKSKSPGPRNRNRNRNNNRSKSPNPGGQKGKGRSKSPTPSGQKGKGPSKSKSPTRRNNNNKNNNNNGKAPQAKENQSPAAAPVVETKPPTSPFLMVDGLFVAMSNDYLSKQTSTSMDVVLQSNMGTNKATAASTSSAHVVSTLEKHLTAAFYCDPALNFIVSEAKTTEFIPTRGREPTANHDNKAKQPKNSAGGNKQKNSNNNNAAAAATRGKSPKKKTGGRSKSPGPRQNNKGGARSKSPKKNNGGRSKSPGPRQKQTKSKSPARPKKSTPAKNTPPPAKENKTNAPKATLGIPKLPLHVQFDPFMVGMVTQTMDTIVSEKKISINTNDRITVLAYQNSAITAKEKGSIASIHATMLPQTYLEVEPLIGQMVPEEIADAINMELSKRENVVEDTAVEEEAQTFKTPAKQGKPEEAESEDVFKTPPKDFKGRVAFFEKLTQQRTAEKPKFDPSKKVKAEVSEKVRSAHDQVRTSLGGGNKAPKKASKADLPKDLTPLAEKRERVDKFFEKNQEAAPAPKSKQPSNWAKVETAPPSSFAEKPEEVVPEVPAATEDAPKVEKLVTEKENELKAKEEKANGGAAKKGKGRSKSPKRNKGRSKSPKPKAPAPAPTEQPKTTTLTEAKESQAAPVAQEKVVPPTEQKESPPPQPEPAAATETKPEPDKPQQKGRGKSPRRNKGKSKSPARPKKTESEKVELAKEVSASLPDEEPATVKQDEPPAVEKATTEPALVEEKTPEVVKETESSTKENKSAETAVAQSTKETHAETLSRDVAAEVLKESKNVDKATSNPAADEFPSLAAGKPKSAWNADRKSFATILSEGKKQEQATKETPGSRFLIPELALAGIDVKAIETNLKESQKDKADTANLASGKKDDQAQKAKTEKSAKSKAAQQKKVESSSRGMEETKEDVGSDPGFNPRKRDAKKKKKKSVGEPDHESVQHSEPISEPISTEAEDMIGSKAFKKHNFNQFDALFEVDVPTEIVADPNGKKEKVRALKTATPTRPSSKKKKGAQTKAKEPKNLSREMEFPDELEESPPTIALPLHWVNNIAHTKPWCYVIDGFFWVLALLLGAPIGAIGIVLVTIYKLIMFFPRVLGLGKINPKSSSKQQLAVVITGCDSGFGKDLAFSLLDNGFVVFCGCLRKESLKAFENEKLAKPILMDVTKDSDVDKASREVSKWLSGGDGRYLHALVNNAGVASNALVDWFTVDEFQKMVDVNFMGMARCTKKFLPHFKLQATKGTYTSARIVNMVSMAGVVSGGLYTVGYEASKHAAEVFTANLRQEMKSFGLKVTVINPSFHKTPMTKDLTADLRRKWKSLPAQKRKELGGDEYIKQAANLSRVASEALNWESRHVVDAMQESVEAKSPPARILVGGDAKYILIVIRMLPTWASSRLLSLQYSNLTKTVKKSKVD